MGEEVSWRQCGILGMILTAVYSKGTVRQPDTTPEHAKTATFTHHPLYLCSHEESHTNSEAGNSEAGSTFFRSFLHPTLSSHLNNTT